MKLKVIAPIPNPIPIENMSPNLTDSSIILNVTVPMKMPAEKEARSARNLKGCLYSLEIIEAIKKGDATNNDTIIVSINDSKKELV
jgi:hypothetical protein